MSRRRGTLAALGVLAAVLMLNAVLVAAHWPFPEPVIAREMGEAADVFAPTRTLNVTVGLALRDAATASGADRVALQVPEGLDFLMDIPAEEFGAHDAPTLNPSLLRPLLGDRIVVLDYDPVLASDGVAALDADEHAVRYAHDVTVAHPAGSGGGTYRLFVDPARRRVFLVLWSEGALQ